MDFQVYLWEYTARVFRWYADWLSSEVENHEAEQRIVDFWPDPKALNHSLRVKLAAAFAENKFSHMARKLDPKTWNRAGQVIYRNHQSPEEARLYILLGLVSDFLLEDAGKNDPLLGHEIAAKLGATVTEARSYIGNRPNPKRKSETVEVKKEAPQDQAPKEEPPQQFRVSPFQRHPKR